MFVSRCPRPRQLPRRTSEKVTGGHDLGTTIGKAKAFSTHKPDAFHDGRSGRPAQVKDAGFELEVRRHRWDWSSEIYDRLGISDSLLPRTELLLAAQRPDDRAMTVGMLSGVLDRGQSFRFQSRLVRGDVRQRTVESTGTLALTSDGRPDALIGTAVVADWESPTFEEPLTGSPSEGKLAVALVGQVKEAHAYVFRLYASIVAQASRRVLRDSVQVDDVVQSVFEGLWCHPGRFDPTRGSLATYLQLAARTRSIDIVRSESARSERTIRFACGGGTIDSPEEEIIAATASDDIRRLLDFLPETERAPVELAYFRSMTYRSVATHLGLPEGTVKSRIRAGLSRLRELGVVGMASDG
jgi:RNA polymerase sigma factor (sigma-70 family)